MDESNERGDTSHKIISENLKKLEDKATLSAEAYLKSSNKLSKIMGWVLAMSIIDSIILGMLAIIIPLLSGISGFTVQVIGIILAFSALGVSFFSLSDRIFGWGEKKSAYDMGFKIWTGYVRESQGFRKNELISLNEERAYDKAKIFQGKYVALVTSLPPNGLTDKEFLECKRDLKRKIRVSKMLDIDPCVDIDSAYDCHDQQFQVESMK
mgnify:FL=1